MPAKKQTKKSLKNADIVVGGLPADYYPENERPEVEQLYCVFVDGAVLKTPAGTPIYHKEDRPLRELAAELEFMDHLDVHKVSLYSLCCSQLDFMEKGAAHFEEDELREWLLNDGALRTCAGPEFIDQMKYMQVIEQFFLKNRIRYPHLPQIPLGNVGLEMARMDGTLEEIGDENFYTYKSDENFNQLVKFVHSINKHFDVFQQTVFTVSMTVIDSVILSTMLALQKISPRELAISYMLANGVSEKVWGGSSRKAEQEFFNEIQKIAECMTRYLTLFPRQVSEIERIIQNGESNQLEFKSTLRWNIKANLVDTEIEHAVLKSIVAFLNTDGGMLLVGVKDDGTILGIEKDQFPNEDKYLLHFANILNERVGKRFADLVKWDLVQVQDKKILQVKCEKSPTPIFLINKGLEEFFVRTGPSTVLLSAREILEYSKRRF